MVRAGGTDPAYHTNGPQHHCVRLYESVCYAGGRFTGTVWEFFSFSLSRAAKVTGLEIPEATLTLFKGCASQTDLA